MAKKGSFGSRLLEPQLFRMTNDSFGMAAIWFSISAVVYSLPLMSRIVMSE